jgi:hypothetical protein
MSTDEFDITISDSTTPPVPGRRRNNFTATTDPTADHDWILGSFDPDHNYEVGSRWINTVTGTVWTCVDSTTTAAVWTEGGGSSGISLHTDLTVNGAYDVDHDDGVVHDLTLDGNATLTPIATTVVSGDAIEMAVIIRQDSGGGNTLAWGGTIDWESGSAPTMPTAGDAFMTVHFRSVDDAASWIGYSGSGGGPDLSAVDFLVGTASGLLSGEIVVGTTPGGELGGTWASPTVDTTHSGSSHASILSGSNAVGPILISDTHSTPIIFADLILSEDEDDFLYADP